MDEFMDDWDDDALEFSSVACVEAAVDASLGIFLSELILLLRRIDSLINACAAKRFLFGVTIDGDCSE